MESKNRELEQLWQEEGESLRGRVTAMMDQKKIDD